MKYFHTEQNKIHAYTLYKMAFTLFSFKEWAPYSSKYLEADLILCQLT